MKKEEIEKMLLIYILYRKELEIEAKNDNKICNNKQLHEYAFTKIVEDYKLK